MPGFQARWYGRMHRIDKFFHQVAPAPDDPPPTAPRGGLHVWGLRVLAHPRGLSRVWEWGETGGGERLSVRGSCQGV